MEADHSLSVVMPNYNHARFLPVSLGAIVSQSFPIKEVIVLDDASTDNSIGVLQEFAKSRPVVSIMQNEKNLGVVSSMNKLLSLASGDHVHFAAADDMVLPGFFEKSMELLKRFPEAGLCSTMGRIIDEAGEVIGVLGNPTGLTRGYLRPDEVLENLLRTGTWIHGNSVIFRRRATTEAGGFIPELGSSTDWFMHQVLGLRHGLCFVPEELVCWRLMGTGFHMTSRGDPIRSLQVRQEAARLMRSTYRKEFPEHYVKELLYRVGQETWRDLRLQQDRLLASDYWSGIGWRWTNSLFLKALGLSMWVQDVGVRMRLFAEFREFRYWFGKRRALRRR
ncbi:MAG: glycosyltransferase [Chloroflexi bacterium]|nr:glycosyltransferase [Chloroflexota bacterium]